METSSSILIRAVGDILFGDSHLSIGHGTRAICRSEGFGHPFDRMGGGLKGGADLLFGNLECALTGRTGFGKKPFIGDLGAIDALVEAGFDVLALANNHMFEYDEGPARETENALEKRGVAAPGLPGREPVTRIERGDVNIALHVWSLVRSSRGVPVAPGPADLIRAIEKSVARSEWPVVSLHWGAEFVGTPSPSQVRFGRALIDAGARLVIGHHTHTVQPVEAYRDGVIIYSMGNFVFDMTWSRHSRDGLLVDVVLPKVPGERPVCTITPIEINDHFQPVPSGEPLGLDEYHQRQFPSVHFDRIADSDEEAYAALTWEKRAGESVDMKRYIRKNLFRLPPASIAYLVAGKLDRLAGRAGKPSRSDVEAAWRIVR